MRNTILSLSLALVVGLVVQAAEAAEWGILTGTFIYDGDVPTPSPLSVTKDAEFCGKHNLVDESLVVNKKNGGVANIVVYMYLKRGAEAPAIHESYAATEKGDVSLDNDKCRFVPRVVLLRTTQTLVIGNKDPVGHNTKVDTFTNPAINYTIPAGAQLKQEFPLPERIPAAQVSCSIHPWMKCWLIVKDNPYFAVTDEDGKLELKNIPAGDWTFQFWHERVGYVADVKLDGASTTWERGRVDVKVTPAGVDLGEVRLSPSIFEKDS